MPEPGQPPILDVLPTEEAAKRIGEKLYAVLFASHMQSCLASSLRSVDPQRRRGLRFLINTTDAPDLARLPWEFLYSPELDDFIFSDRMKPVIRWLDVDQPPPTLAVEPPLRLLKAIAAPKDRPELRVGEELAHLDTALRDLADQGKVETVRLEHATLERLDDALLKNKPHVLHFIGHGDFAGNDGVVFLEAETPPGAADPITGRRLGVLLRNHLGSLRFVFLNSCLGAAVSRSDPFGGVAQSLIRRGMPAVIAMQFPIPDRVAVTLARHFYRYLAAGLPVDAALTSARAFLFARGYPVEWGAPALHMRTPDGRIFALAGADHAATLPAGPAVAPPIAKTEEQSAGTIPQAAETPARALGRPVRSWKWLGLALFLLGLLALASYLTLSREAPQTQAPAKNIPPLDVAPGATPSPAPPTAREIYDDALRALNAGDTSSAFAALDAARRVDADGSALASAPEIRDALFQGILASVRKELAAGNVELARQAANALMAIDKQRAAKELRKLFPTAGPRPPPVAGTHRVRSGDTLWSIAAASYGNPALWPKIYDANRERIRDPNLIYPNQELVIPTLPSALAALSRQQKRHRVQNGDNLWKIAGAVYGDATLWPRIFDANRERINNPHLITPDQELIIPHVGVSRPEQ
jgi:nucleoid-associated protein YgaU